MIYEQYNNCYYYYYLFINLDFEHKALAVELGVIRIIFKCLQIKQYRRAYCIIFKFYNIRALNNYPSDGVK